MSAYKEFEGKTLDEAIRGACTYYDTTRDKLEIDILNDAKAGIFGLVGTKKARVRARLVELASVLEGLDSLSGKEKAQKKRNEPPLAESRRGKRDARDEAPRKERAPKQAASPANLSTDSAASESAENAETTVTAVPAASGDQTEGRQAGRHARGGRRERSRSEERRTKPESGKNHDAEKVASPALPSASLAGEIENADMDADGEEFSRVPFEQLDAAELEAAAREIVGKLTEPFLGPVTIGVSMGSDRVRISVTDVEDPGLLIGRDGQTLASLQYLVTRMLSNRMKALLRVQIDAGDYRERQDERLREMALSLAEKVKAGGRPQVTRPLSSYHRRVIHLTLQDDPQIQTHSKGEGEMKRVMVARRKDRA